MSTSPPLVEKCWEIYTGEISKLSRPRKLLGAAVTFDAGSSHYVIGFGVTKSGAATGAAVSAAGRV